jgi:hypothetical protein
MDNAVSKMEFKKDCTEIIANIMGLFYLYKQKRIKLQNVINKKNKTILQRYHWKKEGSTKEVKSIWRIISGKIRSQTFRRQPFLKEIQSMT